MRSPWSIAVDAAVLVAFAVIGRASHAERLDVAGIAETAWPFLVAGLIGSGLGYALVRFSWLVQGLVVWAAAALGGLVLRVATGGTAAPAFVAVASATLGLLLVGWRGLAHLASRRRVAARRS